MCRQTENKKMSRIGVTLLKLVKVKTQEWKNYKKKDYFFVKLNWLNGEARSIENSKKRFLQNFKQAQAYKNV